jgi:hypothetical protein
MPRFQPLTGLLAAITVCLVTACASTANVDYKQNYDFSTIHNIQVVVPTQSASRDTRINSPLVSTRIRKAIDSHLRARGFHVTRQNADAILRYQLNTRSGLDNYGTGISFGFGHFGRHSGVGIGYDLPGYDVDSYNESVLTIDILDSHSNELLWRGSSTRRLTDGMTPQKLDETVNELVSETLANFPPLKR